MGFKTCSADRRSTAALWSGTNPVFFVNWCQDFISAALVVQLSFRIPGRSISSVAWAAPDGGCSTKNFPACWLLAATECAQGELVKTAAKSLHSEYSSFAQ